LVIVPVIFKGYFVSEAFDLHAQILKNVNISNIFLLIS